MTGYHAMHPGDIDPDCVVCSPEMIYAAADPLTVEGGDSVGPPRGPDTTRASAGLDWDDSSAVIVWVLGAILAALIVAVAVWAVSHE